MWQIKLNEFLDVNGNIDPECQEPTQMMIGYMAGIVEHISAYQAHQEQLLHYACYRVVCHGHIIAKQDRKTIHWHCNQCAHGGRITHWQNTQWDKSGVSESTKIEASTA